MSVLIKIIFLSLFYQTVLAENLYPGVKPYDFSVRPNILFDRIPSDYAVNSINQADIYFIAECYGTEYDQGFFSIEVPSVDVRYMTSLSENNRDLFLFGDQPDRASIECLDFHELVGNSVIQDISEDSVFVDSFDNSNVGGGIPHVPFPIPF